MVSSLNQGTPARDFMDGVVHVICREVNYDTPGVSVSGTTGGVILGGVPAGARILGVHAHVATAFNAGSTNVLTVGVTGDSGLDNIIDAATSGSSFTEGSAGYAVAQPLAAFAQVTSDSEIKVAYNQTGTAATAGKAYVSLYYATTEPSR